MTSFFVALICATQATALSCLRPDPATSFAQFKNVPEAYYILHGTIEFDASQLPQGVVNEQRDPEPIPGQFVGKGLTYDGFTAALNRPVTVQSICAGPWCGQIASDTPYLLFARVSEGQITLDVGPCGGTAFETPTEAVLNKMTACINDEACSPEPLEQ